MILSTYKAKLPEQNKEKQIAILSKDQNKVSRGKPKG
jgi:hypothetical protein